MTPPRPVEFAFADPARRIWLALNREGTAYHVVNPIPADAQLVIDGVRRVGDLGCSCAGGRFRGSCYVVKAAEARERVAAAETNWFDSPAGAGESVEAFRG